jgi:hypothetical protein
MTCWLAEHGVHERGPMPPCDGQLVRAHLLPRQHMRKAWATIHHLRGSRSPRAAIHSLTHNRLSEYVEDPRGWVAACGGPQGNGGHHAMLDVARTLRVPPQELPEGLWHLAAELGLTWWLEREYGRLEQPVRRSA